MNLARGRPGVMSRVPLAYTHCSEGRILGHDRQRAVGKAGPASIAPDGPAARSSSALCVVASEASAIHSAPCAASWFANPTTRSAVPYVPQMRAAAVIA
jgi:hypothetical protein